MDMGFLLHHSYFMCTGRTILGIVRVYTKHILFSSPRPSRPTNASSLPPTYNLDQRVTQMVVLVVHVVPDQVDRFILHFDSWVRVVVMDPS